MRMRSIGFLFALVLMSTGAFAQGVQTGTIRGTVKDAQDLAVPGVTVTVTSPSLQGARSTTTDTQGGYVLQNLPPGDYQVRFELSGFGTVTQRTAVPLGLTVEQNVSIRPSGVAETVNVVGETPAPIASPVVGANFKHDEIESLANLRTIQGIAQLAPATTTNSPNATQVVINGAFAFDNVFMVNGVDINDNLFGTPLNLFVEDAIEETQVLTSGISAEYGRFSGGVINAITKSGSNRFSGSARVNFLNPSWTTATPFEVAKGQATVDAAHPNDLLRSYEGTFGGPIVKDRLWFFGSGRYSSTATPATLPVTGLVVSQGDTNKRGEIKLTGTVSQNQTIQGGFFNDPRSLTNTSGLPNSFLIDPHDLVSQNQPNWYYFTNYKGVLKNNLLVEAQYSERHFQFNQTGPSGSNILDSPFLDLNQSVNYNAPYFDANDPEDRNNRQFTGNVTSYWKLAGRHETKGGYEWFRSQRTGGNSQSSTDYVFASDFVTDASGNPVLDPVTSKPIPMFVPGTSYLQYYPAIKGAALNIVNNSLFLQDHWTINGRWSADLGARFEHVTAVSTGGIVSIDNNRIVPRLAVGYDIQGNGNHTVHASYAQYSGRYNEAQIGGNSPVGNPPFIQSTYQGPAGQGYGFAPGVNVANYPITAANVTGLADPTQNVFMAPGTKSPLTHEFTASYGANLFNGRGYAEVSYVARVTHDLIEDFQTLQGGVTDIKLNGIDAGLFTNVIYQNTPLANREYQGMVFQSRYRFSDHWTLNGHYSLQLKNDGNYEGEGSSTPGATSNIGNYPEAQNAARNFPDGRLQDFQRSRLRIWSVYDWKMGRLGDLSLSGLWRVDSARVFSLASRNQNLTQTQLDILANAGYPDATIIQTVFYGARGSQEFAGYGVLDTSINYDIPVFRSLRPWLKVDIYNLFDNLKLIAWNTTVNQNPAAGVDNLGLATSYTPGRSFGTATGNTVTNVLVNNINAYPLAFNGATPGGRTFRVSLGFRF
jgi:hypothetical protein